MSERERYPPEREISTPELLTNSSILRQSEVRKRKQREERSKEERFSNKIRLVVDIELESV